MAVTRWHGGATLGLEAAFSSGIAGTGVWNTGIWDGAVWGPDVAFVDISIYARSIKISTGRSRPFDHYQAGTAEIVVSNKDGRFAPENMSGPYVSAGVTQIRPWRPMRVVASSGSASSVLYFGYIETISEQFPGTEDATVTFHLVDEIAKLAAFNGFEQDPVGGGELAGYRMHRILNNAGSTVPRAIDLGSATMQATTLAQNAWTDLLLTADSDGGDIWFDGEHGIIYEGASALFSNTRSNTVQATFTDDASALRFQDIEFAYSGDELVNIAALSRAGGEAQIWTDNDSRALYGDHQFARNDLVCESDSQVVSLAAHMVQTRSAPELRVASIKVMPMRDPANVFPQVIGRRIRDRIRVIYHHPAGFTMQRDCFIDGIEHDIDVESWVTVFHTSSAAAFVSAINFAAWDISVFDAAAFSY